MSRLHQDAVIARWCRKRAIHNRPHRVGHSVVICVECMTIWWEPCGKNARSKFCSAACHRRWWGRKKRGSPDGVRPRCRRCDAAPTGFGRRYYCDPCALRAEREKANALQRAAYAVKGPRKTFASRYAAVEHLRMVTPPGRCLWCDRTTHKMAHRHALLCGGDDCDRMHKNLLRREREAQRRRDRVAHPVDKAASP